MDLRLFLSALVRFSETTGIPLEELELADLALVLENAGVNRKMLLA